MNEPLPEVLVWLSTASAATRLGITTRTLYRLADEGHVPAYKFGRVLRFRLDEVDAFIERARVRPGDLRHLYQPADRDVTDVVDGGRCHGDGSSPRPTPPEAGGRSS